MTAMTAIVVPVNYYYEILTHRYNENHCYYQAYHCIYHILPCVLVCVCVHMFVFYAWH